MEALPEPDMPVITTSCVGVSCGRLRERLALPTGFAEVATSRYYHAKLGTIARKNPLWLALTYITSTSPASPQTSLTHPAIPERVHEDRRRRSGHQRSACLPEVRSACLSY